MPKVRRPDQDGGFLVSTSGKILRLIAFFPEKRVLTMIRPAKIAGPVPIRFSGSVCRLFSGKSATRDTLAAVFRIGGCFTTENYSYRPFLRRQRSHWPSAHRAHTRARLSSHPCPGLFSGRYCAFFSPQIQERSTKEKTGTNSCPNAG